MTQASERQGPGMAIRQLLIEASVDASELPKHGSLGGLGGQQAGRRLRLSTAGHLLLAGAILAMAFQRGFGFTPGGPEPATHFGLLQQGSNHVASTLYRAATTTRRYAAASYQHQS